MTQSLRTPIAVFAFARAQHLEAALVSLARCSRFGECALHIFCDGPRNDDDSAAVEATRRVARAWAHKLGCSVVEKQKNEGLALSISEGVTSLCEESGRIIVVEDDLYVSPDFLDFILRSLDVYQDAETVFQVGGFMYPIDDLPRRSCYLLPYTSSWGWATWWRAWKQYDFYAKGWRELIADRAARKRFDLDGSFPFSEMLAAQGRGTESTWDIQWYFAMFRACGLALYPSRSLVRNNGMFGQASHPSRAVTHSPGSLEAFDVPRLQAPYDFPSSLTVDGEALDRIRHYLGRIKHLEREARVDRVLCAPLRLARRFEGLRRGK